MKDDLISKAALVDAIESVDWYHIADTGEMVHGANDDEHQAWYKSDDIYKAIEALPNAQPSATDTNVGGNLIDRQAALDAIKKLEKPAPTARHLSAIFDCEDTIKALPPAQPETAKRIVGKSRDGMTLWYQCEMCNEPVDAQDNFCRGCGRRLTDG